MNIGNQYHYGSNQTYPAQENIESYTLSNTGPPPAQIDHKEPNTSLSSTVADPSVSAPTGDAQIVTQILKDHEEDDSPPANICTPRQEMVLCEVLTT